MVSLASNEPVCSSQVPTEFDPRLERLELCDKPIVAGDILITFLGNSIFGKKKTEPRTTSLVLSQGYLLL